LLTTNMPGAREAADDTLAAALVALGSPTRLALLRAVRAPKALREIDVRIADPAAPGAPPRPLARQTVKEHLDRLLEAGLVTAREAERDYGPTVEYSLNHQELFGLAELLRELARLRPVAEPRNPTVEGLAPPPPFDLAGPCLVLVKGLDDGRVFDLPAPAIGRKEWVMGRSRGADIALDFDQFISAENTAITWEDGTYFVRDLEESRNGTTLNYQPLPKGTRRALRTGDLVGVGRALLMFRR
jgi:DNA-binding transcriptional ArsR family regulator